MEFSQDKMPPVGWHIFLSAHCPQCSKDMYITMVSGDVVSRDSGQRHVHCVNKDCSLYNLGYVIRLACDGSVVVE